MRRFPFHFPAINFSGRSPFQIRGGAMPGVPPALIPAETVRPGDSGAGSARVGDTPLPLYGAPAHELVRAATGTRADADVMLATYCPSMYGNMATFPIVFGAAGELVALDRPSQTRISLLVQNLSVVGNIFYCFDRPADNVSCVAIGAGGNRLFDFSVPQGDLHIFSTGAGVVIVEYMNQDISSPQASA